MKEKLMKKVLSCAAAMVMCLNLGTAVVSAEAYTDAATIEAKLTELSVDLTLYNKLANKDVVISELVNVDFADDEAFEAAFEAAMDKYVSEEKVYPSKVVKMVTDNGGSAEDVSQANFNLQWNTFGMFSYSVDEAEYVIDMELSTAALGNESVELPIGINSVSFDNPPSEVEYTKWNDFVPKNATDLMTITPTITYGQYVTTQGFYDNVVDADRFTGNITLRLTNATNNKVIQLFSAYPTYLIVTRDYTGVYNNLVNEINGANDVMTVETILGLYLNSDNYVIPQLDSERYFMMDNPSVFAKEFLSKDFESFSALKTTFDAALEKYVPATVIDPEWYMLHAANQVDSRMQYISEFNIKQGNDQSALFGYDFNSVAKDNLKKLAIRVKNKTNHNLDDTNINVSYDAVTEYPFAVDTTTTGWSTTGNEYHTAAYANIINNFAQVNVFALPNEADSYLEENLNDAVKNDIISNNNAKLMIRLSRSNGNQVTIYPDVEIIAYNDLSGVYAELDAILGGTASATEIKSWTEANGESIEMDKNALYDMNGVYSALAGKAYADTEELLNAFNEEVAKYMVARYVEAEHEVTRADGGAIYRFYKNSLPVANGNGWNNLIFSFPITENEYINDIEFVNTLGYPIDAGKSISIISYTTEEIPALPEAEASKDGFELDNTDTTGVYEAWKDYYSKFILISGISHTFDATADTGTVTTLDLGEAILSAVKADATQLNIVMTATGNVQVNSVYGTDETKIPARLKITYDSTAIKAKLLDSINNATDTDSVLSALSEYGFILPEYEWFTSLNDEAKLSAATAVFGNKNYNDATEISAVLNLIKVNDGNAFVITGVETDGNGKVTKASVTKLDDYSGSVTICSAYYNDNQMVYIGVADAGQEPVAAGASSDVTLKTEYNGDFDTVKVFVLETLTTIKPLAQSYTK